MSTTQEHLVHLRDQIKQWGSELGFQQTAITDTDLTASADRLQQWLAAGYQGEMDWMASHGSKRWQPAELLPGTTRVISIRMDYLPPETALVNTLRNPSKGFISRYALGRDYHKLIRKRLSQLCNLIEAEYPGSIIQRPFVDSAPVLEKPLAEKAGLGWMGKNTLILNSKAGSWFFLGEIFINLPLPIDHNTETDRCGNCSACLTICPTNAFPAPYQLDARRCISYLTIEHKGEIPEEIRPLMGNRVFGCDDCQAICPWNRFAKATAEDDFKPRHNLDNSDLVELMGWTAEEFERKTAGSPIRRIGFERWQRNIAVALGNAPPSKEAITTLEQCLDTATPLVKRHITWALDRQTCTSATERPIKLFPELRLSK